MRLTIQERERRAREREARQQARKEKAFRKTVMTKDVASFSKDETGFVVIKYRNGQTFKCRGPIVESAGLL